MQYGIVSRAASGMVLAAVAAGPIVGCSSLPGNEKQQGTVIGGLSGAAAGAVIGGEENRGVGALIGGLLGAGGGYLIGAQVDDKDEDDAREAAERARRRPASALDVRDSRTADLNDDGFVSIDEVVAMERSELSDREIIDRLRATDQVFHLTPAQEDQLRDRGVSRDVINAMRDMGPGRLSYEDDDDLY